MHNDEIAKHSSESYNEARSVRLLSDRLEEGNYIKTFFNENDKTPNTDGYFELCDEDGRPVKRFVVQIRKTNSLRINKKGKHKGEYGYRLKDLKFFNYVKHGIDDSPALYFVVDIHNKTIFYIYLSTTIINKLCSTSTSRPIYYFQENDRLLDINAFVEVLHTIIKERNRKLSMDYKFVHSFLEGDAYTGDMIRKLMEYTFGAWDRLEFSFAKGMISSRNYLEDPLYFSKYYSHSLRAAFSIEEYDMMRHLYSRLMVDAFNYDFEYAKRVTEMLNKFFNEYLCIDTSEFVLSPLKDNLYHDIDNNVNSYKTINYNLNKQRIYAWIDLLYDVLSFCRRNRTTYKREELQDVCVLRVTSETKSINPSRPIPEFADTPQNTVGKWRYKICLVDDDITILTDLENSLRHVMNEQKKPYEYDIDVFRDPNAMRLSAQKHAYDVIVYDVVFDYHPDEKDLYNSEYIYHGEKLHKVVLDEREEKSIEPRVFVYSELSYHELIEQFNFPNAEPHMKDRNNIQKTNNLLAKNIMHYLDTQFYSLQKSLTAMDT